MTSTVTIPLDTAALIMSVLNGNLHHTQAARQAMKVALNLEYGSAATFKTGEHPLKVFAQECVIGAYPESELADAATRALAHPIHDYEFTGYFYLDDDKEYWHQARDPIGFPACTKLYERVKVTD